MKKTLKLIVCSFVALTLFIGCSVNEKLSKSETEIVDMANQLIMDEYKIEFNSEDYNFSAGKQISENEFVEFDSDAKQGKEFENIVSVSALKKTLAEKNEISMYQVIFNIETKEVIDIYADVQVESKE